MQSFPMARLEGLGCFRTGKLDSNAAKPGGKYPFFTCSQETFRTDTYSFDGEYVLLAGNNAAGIYPLKYFRGKFDAYQRTYAIRSLKSEVLLTRYLYYALRPQLELLKSISTGAATKFLTLTLLNATEISLPRVPAQRKIVTVLSGYDNLIENNRRRIEILEKMARLIYGEWFVQFRFPGHEDAKLVDSSLGKIPEAWQVCKLGDLLSAVESGKRPRGGIDQHERGVPSVGAENIKGLGQYDYAKEKYVSEEFFHSMRKGHVRDKDVLVYKDGAYIGRSSYFRDSFPHVKCCINEHVFILRVNDRITQNLLYFWLQERSTVSTIRGTNANTAQPGINQKGVRGLSFLVPSSELVTRLDTTVEPIVAQIVSLAKRNRVLQESRDLLLPRLISGELDVSELPIETGADDGNGR